MQKISKNIAISESGFIFNRITGDSFTCNEVAADIIQFMKENQSIEEIRKKIVEKYAVQEAELEKDLQDFWMQMRDFNLLENQI